jgi:hypothetical protein
MYTTSGSFAWRSAPPAGACHRLLRLEQGNNLRGIVSRYGSTVFLFAAMAHKSEIAVEGIRRMVQGTVSHRLGWVRAASGKLTKNSREHFGRLDPWGFPRGSVLKLQSS